MALWVGCFRVTELSVAACSVAACHACKNVCEARKPENCGLVPKKGLRCVMTEQHSDSPVHGSLLCDGCKQTGSPFFSYQVLEERNMFVRYPSSVQMPYLDYN